MKRILVTGASGLVGSYFCRLLQEFDAYFLNHSGVVSEKSLVANLSDGESFLRTLKAIRPDIIVHLAAMTNVDKCEVEKEEADRVNHIPLKYLSRYLDENNSCFALYVSTDYIFDGLSGSYNESDVPMPVNWYGTTKLHGETEISLSRSTNWCIARTSTPYGIHDKKESFPLFVIKNLSSGKEVAAVTDQITSPTHTGNLANMLLEILERKMTGIIHVAGGSKLSRYEQAVMIARIFGLDDTLIKPVAIKDIKWKAPRPQNSSLSISKATDTLINKPIEYEKGLRMLSEEIRRL
jgi:dTDP-4-dehydrorhamnose reductase